MRNTSFESKGCSQRRPAAAAWRVASAIGTVLAWVSIGGAACAQTPSEHKFVAISAPAGYALHHSVDLGGRISSQTGSAAFYDTLVNLQSGPRVLGESFELRALPDNKKPWLDNLQLFSSGWGGDPNDVIRATASKKKLYEFSGLFRRDRQYFDYDLLGNPNIPIDKTLPIGSSASPTGSFAWPQVMQSPVWFNTVRRMTDTSLTLFPLATFSFRAAYAQNIFQGPSSSPSYAFAAQDALLLQYQRNSTDDFIGALEWKAARQTRVTYEQQITHYKNNTYYVLSPLGFIAQEADGTPVALGGWDALEPLGYAAASGATTYTLSTLCTTAAMGSGYTNSTTYTIFTANPNTGGLPIINPACKVITSYVRYEPYRTLTPTETLRFQSADVKHVAMNGDIRFTQANMNLPNYYDQFQGLNGATRQITITGQSKANRQSLVANLGAIWETTKSVSLADQASFFTIHQPGSVLMNSKVTLAIPGAASNDSINYIGTLTSTAAASGATVWAPTSIIGTASPGYFGQESFTNNFTASWDLSAKARFSLTYKYGNRTVAEGVPHNQPLSNTEDTGDPVQGTIQIIENGGLLRAALRPASNFDLNGSVEYSYADNAVTPVSPRQSWQYKIRAKYRPTPWAVVTAAYNDRERHNNTNNAQLYVANGLATYNGPIKHEDYNRSVSFGGTLQKSELLGVDFFYAYTRTYAKTNTCYTAIGSTWNTYMPGALPGPTGIGCSSTAGRLTPGQYTTFAADYIDAPTQFGSVSLTSKPVKSLAANLGLRISAVNGSRFFNDARDVYGSLISTYQSPFANLAWTMHPGLVWKAEYNYFGYGEGGPGGAQYCTLTNPATFGGSVAGTPCSTITNSALTWAGETSAGATAPRNFHANNVALGVHYEF